MTAGLKYTIFVALLMIDGCAKPPPTNPDAAEPMDAGTIATDWPGDAFSAVMERTCSGHCEELDLLLWEYREIALGSGKLRVQYIFIFAHVERESSPFEVATYYNRDDGPQSNVWRLDRSHLGGFGYFASRPTVDEVLAEAEETWNFSSYDWVRGTLLDYEVYDDAWEHAVGERPTINYPD